MKEYNTLTIKIWNNVKSSVIYIIPYYVYKACDNKYIIVFFKVASY